MQILDSSSTKYLTYIFLEDKKTGSTLELCPPWRQTTSLIENYGEHSFFSNSEKKLLWKIRRNERGSTNSLDHIHTFIMMVFHQIQKRIKRTSAKKAIYYLNVWLSGKLFSPSVLHFYLHFMKKAGEPDF